MLKSNLLPNQSNAAFVIQRVKKKLEALKAGLPAGVTIDVFYDRSELVQRTQNTVAKNLIEGGLLVVAVLLLLLGSVRGGLIVAVAIPLSMLCAFIGMRLAGLSGNLMSLGAIDFGLVVDSSGIGGEDCVRRLGLERATRWQRI